MSCLERVLETSLSLENMQEGRRRAALIGNMKQKKTKSYWGRRRRNRLSGRGECSGDQLTLLPCQQAQTRLSTGARGLGLTSTKAWRAPAAIESKAGIVQEVQADLTGSLGDRMRRGSPESSIIPTTSE